MDHNTALKAFVVYDNRRDRLVAKLLPTFSPDRYLAVYQDIMTDGYASIDEALQAIKIFEVTGDFPDA